MQMKIPKIISKIARKVKRNLLLCNLMKRIRSGMQLMTKKMKRLMLSKLISFIETENKQLNPNIVK